MSLNNIVQTAIGGTPGPLSADTPVLQASEAVQPDIPENEPDKLIDRNPQDPPEERIAFVKRWTERVKRGKKHFEPMFKQMRDDMRFLRGEQWGDAATSREKYTANIVQRHVQQKVSALYAKNPTAKCERRKTLDFKLWDESQASLQAIQSAFMMQQQTAMQGQPMPPNPQAMATLQDFMEGSQKRKVLDKIARTMEITFKYSIDQQEPPFKSSMKQLVRRAVANGVGYVKVGYQRFMQQRPEDIEKITDATQRLATIERLCADLGDGEKDQYSAEAEQLRLLLNDLQAQPDMITKEGLVFDFPSATSIIPDPNCKHLRGFIGAQWVAQEFILTVDDVKEQYGIDLSAADYTKYEETGELRQPSESSSEKESHVCVWEIYSKRDGMLYVVADGYNDFLQEPAEPTIKIDRFWPLFCLTFNEIENEESIYPQSDVTLLRPMQLEYNRSRQGLREHRHANRPKTAVPKGMLDEEDKAKLQSHPANAVLELNALQPGQNVGDVLQPIKMPGIDPNLYETESIFQDVERVAGSQIANLGGTSSATATESSIAESSRMSAIGSNVDDLDDLLSELFRACGQILLREMSPETVTKIAGPGAVWPQLSVNEIAQELILDVEAGSSGRPNKAAEISNFNLIAPTLMQIPGISPEWLAKQAITRLDDRLDVSDALIAGAESITAMNTNKAVQSIGAPASPSDDPNAQGPQGADNTPHPPVASNAPQQPGQPTLPHMGGLQTHAEQFTNA